MKKVLMTATVPSMIGQFNMDNIRILLDMGYEVHIVCNFRDRSVWPGERVKEFIKELRGLGVRYHQIDFSRNPKNIGSMVKAFRQMDKLIGREGFRLVHCHTPLAGVISRIVCHRHKVKVIYTAHGFHFYKGSPKKNWLIYYPIEKYLSRWTDVLITINREDYKLAKKSFHGKKTVYVPGAGIDVEKYGASLTVRDGKRKELNLEEKDIMLLSVGELTARKNHEAVIKALAGMNNPRIKYFIAGRGELEERLRKLIHAMGLEHQVRLLGFRKDVSGLYQAADLFVFPSVQEGLPVALMEAIACKTPVVCSNIRGNADLVHDRRYLFTPWDMEDIAGRITNALSCQEIERARSAEENYENLKAYDRKVVNARMKRIIEECTGGCS